MRLDKFLSEMNIDTRSNIKKLIRQGLVTVNGIEQKSAETKVDPVKDSIALRGKEIPYRNYFYYMMNKPKGVVSATIDNVSETVMDLIRPEHKRDDLFPVGRLDKDTEGFLLITNDGNLAHRLLSPRKHVDKTYFVAIDHSLSTEEIHSLETGVEIGEDALTLPAVVQVLDDTHLYLTIQEGKFHQVKRMLQAVDNQVIALKRVFFGGLQLDASLKPGEYRELRPEELELLIGGEPECTK